ncbi:MAG: tetratricopeptide repeat protein, partial [Gemmatimonadota bacterium]|nr:tetratricopeptide repeat protein [Gemmatimonadota bacterium]
MAYEPELERLERRYQDDPARNFAQLAEAYRKGGRLDDALALLQGHLTERPNYVSGLIVLGRCLLDQQNDAEARETFQRVLGVDAEHIIALRALGEIAERGGDLGGAKEWFTRLLDVDPMNEDAEEALQRIAAGPPAPAPVAPVEAEPGADETISIL